MAEYLAPAVYVEETSFRTKSIEGVGTSTAAFVGLTRKGPVNEVSELIGSFNEFQRVYGGLDPLALEVEVENYLAHGVRVFFENGGGRLYVVRIANTNDKSKATAVVREETTTVKGISFVARAPGQAYNGTITLRMVGVPAVASAMDAAPSGSVVRATYTDNITIHYFLKKGTRWIPVYDQRELVTLPMKDYSHELLTLTVTLDDLDSEPIILEGLGFDPAHPRFIGQVMGVTPGRREDALTVPYVFVTSETDTFALISGLLARNNTPLSASGGLDGYMPTGKQYEDALVKLETIEDISIVAAPGYSALGVAVAEAAQSALISHARPRLYRMAVLDPPRDSLPSTVMELRNKIDSHRAALYYPWAIVRNPRTGLELPLPPSAFICGIYARNDANRGVHKAPANEEMQGVVRLERNISTTDQELLNPRGINCLRFFPGRGYRVWGARTVSSDSEWKYVNVRRYFNYLEASLDRGTQWAVFEPNGERLWANVRDSISSFLYNEWISGALLGSNAKEAFFVRCDRSTMTQNDLDNGRLIAMIGVAVLKPAEFVILRIGQTTLPGMR